MSKFGDSFLWTERYRPKKVSDVILPESLKLPFQKFVDQGNIPNLLLTGPPGTGKTTVALAMLEELGADVFKVNGSLNADKHTLKNDISVFASTVSFTGGRKYVVIDEADYLNLQNVQTGLRSFMEECADNCGFILTCNFPNRLMEAIRSRCAVIEFKILNKDKPKLASAFFKRIEEILKENNVDYDQKAIVELIKKFMPDWRRLLNQLQHLSSKGEITLDDALNFDIVSIQKLIEMMRSKKWSEIKTWMNNHPDMDQNDLFTALSDQLPNYMTVVGDAMAIILLAKYQDFGKNVPNMKINMLGCLAELMVEAEWND